MSNKEKKSAELLTPQQVCELIGGITPKTLREWNIHHRHKKLLTPIRFTHKIVRYERSKVLAFIERCRSID
ncbi:helix-turn-helix domain-containing protein [Edwardsiella anguillarum]|uniref:helix-turn-helix domain-containing protein n=1 Tax=Edwardsiella anguillarum TaxID=1821960 RepID=UPI0024B6A465|nr:helix-turn-helix domain-containing protein [Edwardsiella anguillarum]WHQ13409.1 helix-turn-helix domain-containing protein [Edwardsiella anguillarum]